MSKVEILTTVLALIGIAVGVYGIVDARRQRAERDRVIDRLRSYAGGTERFLIALKPSIPRETHEAVNDQISLSKSVREALPDKPKSEA
jgi:hypothetical protein